MKIIEAGLKGGKTRHYIDCDKYNRLSRSKALCGLRGIKLVRYDAVFCNYKVLYPKLCKKCEIVAKPG